MMDVNETDLILIHEDTANRGKKTKAYATTIDDPQMGKVMVARIFASDGGCIEIRSITPHLDYTFFDRCVLAAIRVFEDNQRGR